MADFLITLGVVLLGVAAFAWTRRGGGKTERRRAKSEADANTRKHEPLTADEQEHAEEIHAIVQEYRTGELAKVVEPRKPTVRDIARKYRRPAKHSAAKLPKTPKSKRFDPLTSPMPVTEKPVMLPAQQPQIDIDSFTQGWSRGDVDRMVAKAKAGAR